MSASSAKLVTAGAPAIIALPMLPAVVVRKLSALALAPASRVDRQRAVVGLEEIGLPILEIRTEERHAQLRRRWRSRILCPAASVEGSGRSSRTAESDYRCPPGPGARDTCATATLRLTPTRSSVLCSGVSLFGDWHVLGIGTTPCPCPVATVMAIKIICFALSCSCRRSLPLRRSHRLLCAGSGSACDRRSTKQRIHFV